MIESNVFPDLPKQTHLTGNLLPNHLTRKLEARLKISQTAACIVVELLRHGSIAYSRNRSHYILRYHSKLSRLPLVTSAVDELEARGWILHDRKPPGSRNRGRQSSMQATDLLFDVCQDVQGVPVPFVRAGEPIILRDVDGEPLPFARPREPIILRDAAGEPMDYRDTRAINRCRNRLKAHGELLDCSTITGCKVAGMARIWNESFNRGGRAYGPWQSLPKAERGLITINGEPVVEPDYDAIHPTILYGMACKPIPADPYDIAGFERKAVKWALLILINASTPSKAQRALAGNLEDSARKQQGRSPLTKEDKFPVYRMKEAGRLINAVKAKHAPISCYFHTGIGCELQSIDSDIMASVWASLTRQSIPALPVHDSVVVPLSVEGKAKELMSEFGAVYCLKVA